MTATIFSLADVRAARTAEVQHPAKPAHFREPKDGEPGSPAWRKRLHYNWNKARALADYYRALRSFTHAASIGAMYGLNLDGVASQDADFGFLDSIRKAEATLLLTPAPTQAELNWKRREVKGGGLRYNPYVVPDQVHAAIFSDEQRLQQYPARMPRSAVQ